MQQHTVRYDLQYNECLCAWMKPCLYKQAASDKTWQNATQKGSWMEEFDGLRFFMGLPLCLNSIKTQTNANVRVRSVLPFLRRRYPMDFLVDSHYSAFFQPPRISNPVAKN
jgi:hypothetical protein